MRNWSVLIGPLLASIIFITPLSINYNSHVLLALIIWVISWWVFSPIPMGVTSLFLASMLSLFGIAELKTCFESFAHPLIFLFMGGFFIAKALEHHNLDRRFALYIISRDFFASNPERTLLGIILATGFSSMWLSNTATSASFLPITLGIIASLSPQKILIPTNQSNIFLLSMAYAATIGGILTPIGSPPNLIALGGLLEIIKIKISFFQWVIYTLPIGIFGFSFLYFFMSRKLKNIPHDPSQQKLFREQLINMGPLSGNQIKIIIIGLGLIIAWLIPGLISSSFSQDISWVRWLKNCVSESSIAIFFSSLLFIIPSNTKKYLLSWKQARDIDCGTLLLFGGGLTLGKMIILTGLGQEIADLAQFIAGGWPFFVYIFVSCGFAIFFTEMSSNTAAANVLVPISISISMAFGFNPVLCVLGICMSCNMAFMLPIATPPNAIVFGSQLIRLRVMIKYGLVLNIVFLLFLTSYLSLLNLFFN